MGRAQPLSTALVALVALAVGFLLAGQVKAQLLTPSNQVGRNQALIRSVQALERTNQVADLRAHAGLTPLHGPGVQVDLANGPPGSDPSGQGRNLVTYQDVQDLVNLLFASGAEGVAVSGRRITPMSAFSGSEGEVIVDQGPPLFSPIKIVAVGDRNGMEAALGDANSLPSLRLREIQYQLSLGVRGAPDESLPAFDGSLEAPHVGPA